MTSERSRLHAKHHERSVQGGYGVTRKDRMKGGPIVMKFS
jgi:hypothetical protein